MRRQTETYITSLSAGAVDRCSELVREFLNALNLPKREVLRYAISVEEILLKTLDSLPEGSDVRLITGDKFARSFIALEIDGEACNVFAELENERGVLSDGILKNLGLSPEFSFAGSTNRYTFRIKRRRTSRFTALAVSIASAVVIGLLGYFLPDALRASCTENILVPLNDAFLNLLGCIAGPMIFLAVAWGIYGIGDAAALKRIGKKVCFSYIGTDALLTVLMCLLALPLFNLSFSSGSDTGSSFSALLTMLLDIIPKDIFSPFVNGNTLQIIFLAIGFGIAMLFLGRKTDFVAKTVEQINYIILFLIEAISNLVPYFIFIVLLKMIWSDTLSVLSGIGKLFAVFPASALISALLIVCCSSVKNRVNPILLIKKNLATFTIALTTASSAAAFGSNLKTARQGYGIDEKLCSFGIPLGVVTFKPTTALNYMIQSLFFAELYSVDVSLMWICIMLISSIILAIATPPIPGGGMATYAVLFAQLGIPAQALGIALACESVFDFIITGFDQFGISLVLLNQSTKLGLTDRSILLDNGKEKEI